MFQEEEPRKEGSRGGARRWVTQTTPWAASEQARTRVSLNPNAKPRRE
jgi:hypothetical protein